MPQSKRSPDAAPAGTVNADEIAKFAALAEQWWDPNGKFKPLHKFNPVRLAYIRERLIAHFGRDATDLRPLRGLRILDVGCGGGLVCEPLTRLGASLTGIDAAARNIAIAQSHADSVGLAIDYRAASSEDLAASGGQFDVVLNLEVVEHVDNVPLYLKSCADLVAPGGLMLTATLNRTARAFALAIVGAEYVLGWLPRGTHEWKKFMTPEEVASLTTRNGLEIVDRTGVVYNPLRDAWTLSPDMAVNYMILAARPDGAPPDL